MQMTEYALILVHTLDTKYQENTLNKYEISK